MSRTHHRSIRGLFIGLILLGLTVMPTAAATGGERMVSDGRLEAGAGAWRPWLLGSGSQFRLPAPPDKRATRAELDQLEGWAAKRDAAAIDQIRFWDSGSPGLRWNELAIRHAQSKGRVGNRAIRMLGLLNVAIADGMIAA